MSNSGKPPNSNLSNIQSGNSTKSQFKDSVKLTDKNSDNKEKEKQDDVTSKLKNKKNIKLSTPPKNYDKSQLDDSASSLGKRK